MPPSFSCRICQLAKQIPSGRVTTYALLVQAAGGHPLMARMVTHFLSKCPDSGDIPYHRIVYSNGRVWLHPRFKATRLKLYRQEGIRLDKHYKIIDFDRLIYLFK